MTGKLNLDPAVVAQARELARRTSIDRVECLWEPYMMLAARLREELGLPGLTAARREIFTRLFGSNRIRFFAATATTST